MKIYNYELKKEQLSNLIKSVKTGKYKEIGEEIIKKEILKELKNNPSLIEKLDKKKHLVNFVKNIKKNLYRGVAIFNEKDVEEHFSIQDRDYKYFSKIISSIKKKDKIVDLGCGLNPLKYKELKLKSEYVAYEINEEYVNQINKFFKENKIKGKAHCKDVLQIKRFPKADVYLLLKLLESVEQKKGHKLSEEIIVNIPAKTLIVSFPTKTISGKPMNVPVRRWMNLMLERLKYSYEIKQEENEIFYIVKKINILLR
ncbi:hypothetical protein KY321_00290 [Candidatus Woesearchaeota archaeon]|nr:hypothetical protein [Candidatus Woesearchaeota archaeon]